MLEDDLRRLFRVQAGADLPPERVSLPAIRRKAAARRHRREIAAIGSPVLAACAVLVVALAGLLPASGRGVAPPAGHAANRAPRHFSMLVPYASFGWLPRGKAAQETGTINPAEDELARRGLMLATFAYRVCRKSGKTELNCPAPSPGRVRLGNHAAAVHGHAAFWTSSPAPALAWQYAPGGWAILWNNPYKPVPERTLHRVADRVQFGGHHQRVRFAVQITRPPAGAAGLVNTLDYVLDSGVLLASNYSVFHHGGRALDISIGRSCTSDGHHIVINGHHVHYWHYPGGTALCALADGLRISMSGPTKPAPANALSTFRKLRILGSDPARWARQPEG
jgi:hypothetical protein